MGSKKLKTNTTGFKEFDNSLVSPEFDMEFLKNPRVHYFCVRSRVRNMQEDYLNLVKTFS
jgi:hypothetical protein